MGTRKVAYVPMHFAHIRCPTFFSFSQFEVLTPGLQRNSLQPASDLGEGKRNYPERRVGRSAAC